MSDTSLLKERRKKKEKEREIQTTESSFAKSA